MKIRDLIIASISATFLLVGCGGSKTEPNVNSTPTEAPEGAEKMNEEKATPEKGGCIYSYIHDSTKINWTAYKFESKAGVGGSFGACEVYPLSESGSVAEVMNGLEFRIPVSGTLTKNEDRDKKIKEHFFGSLASTDLIVGEIVEVSGNEKEGELGMKITMNGETVATKGTYSIENGQVDLMAEIDMTNWKGMDAIAALNKVCEDLHREAPGQKSVLWPNVSVHVKAYLKTDCAE